MHRSHDIRVGHVGFGAPGGGTHRRTAALDVGAGAAVEDDCFATGEFLPDVVVHDSRLLMSGAESPHVELRLRRRICVALSHGASMARKATTGHAGVTLLGGKMASASGNVIGPAVEG